jgi:DNA invertase Pin-like site-specific DNA recombinase
VSEPRVALYARVSTDDQTCENQLCELRAHVALRQWAPAREFIDHGISGAKRSRPALDELLRCARRRQIGVVLCWSLDRLSRSAAHAAALIDELHQLGVTIISVKQGIDTSSPMGRAFGQMAGIFAEIEREAIRERVRTALARLKAAGRVLGRPREFVAPEAIVATLHLSTRQAAQQLRISAATVCRLRRTVSIPRESASGIAPEIEAAQASA